MEGLKKIIFLLSMQVNGTKTRNMGKGSVHILMDQSIKVISSKINSTVTEGTPGLKLKAKLIPMKATGKREKWMEEVNLITQTDRK